MNYHFLDMPQWLKDRGAKCRLNKTFILLLEKLPEECNYSFITLSFPSKPSQKVTLNKSPADLCSLGYSRDLSTCWRWFLQTFKSMTHLWISLQFLYAKRQMRWLRMKNWQLVIQPTALIFLQVSASSSPLKSWDNLWKGWLTARRQSGLSTVTPGPLPVPVPPSSCSSSSESSSSWLRCLASPRTPGRPAWMQNQSTDVPQPVGKARVFWKNLYFLKCLDLTIQCALR